MRSTENFSADQAKEKKLSAQWAAATTVFLGITSFPLGLFVASTVNAPWLTVTTSIAAALIVIFGVLDWRKAGRIH